MNFLLHGSTITYYIVNRVPTSRFAFIHMHQDLHIEIVVGLYEVLNEKCAWLLSISMTQKKGSASSRVLICVDRPTRLRNTWFGFLAFVICMSLSESPFLYDIMGGSVKIRFSNGCCCIMYHFLVKISLRFETAGGYCVMKGKIGFFCLVSLEEGLCPLLKLHF